MPLQKKNDFDQVFNELSRLKAEKAAEEVIARFNIDKFHIDVHQIAASVGIEVIPKPPNIAGASGMLIKNGDNFAIGYATNIDNVGYQRFTIAHELGHYFLDGHAEALLANDNIHYSNSGTSSDIKYEKEADCFAANLLMPRKMFRSSMRTAGKSLEAILKLSDTCITSHEATAIRFTDCHDDCVAMIISKGSVIEYCIMSPEFKRIPSLTWIRRGESLPRNSYTYEFNQDQKNIINQVKKEGHSYLQDWFGGPHELEISEDVFGLGDYGKTLTFLHDINIDEDY